MPSELKNNKQPCCVRWRLKRRSSLFGLRKSIYQATSSLYAVQCSSAAMISVKHFGMNCHRRLFVNMTQRIKDMTQQIVFMILN